MALRPHALGCLFACASACSGATWARHPRELGCLDDGGPDCNATALGPSSTTAAALTQACQDGDLGACVAVAKAFEHRPDGAGEAVKPLAVLERLCAVTNDRQGSSCFDLAQRLASPSSEDPGAAARSLYFLRRACALGYAAGCHEVAKRLEFPTEENAVRDLSGALEYYERACTLGYEHCSRTHRDPLTEREVACKNGDGDSCLVAGSDYASPEFARVSEVDRGKARALFGAGCELDNADACVALAELGVAGRGGDRDLEAGIAAFRRACGLGRTPACGRGEEVGRAIAGCGRTEADACDVLGELYLDGVPTPKDRTRGYEALSKACEARSAAACVRLAKSWLEGDGLPRDLDRAVSLFERAKAAGAAPELVALADELSGARVRCDASDAEACMILARMYMEAWERGQMSADSPDAVKAIARFGQACKLGANEGCVTVGRWLLETAKTPETLEEGVRNLEAACNGKDGAVCYELGERYRQGDRLTANTRRAGELYQAGCAAGDARACYRVGEGHALGLWGLPVDRTAATTAFAAACEGGIWAACDEAK